MSEEAELAAAQATEAGMAADQAAEAGMAADQATEAELAAARAAGAAQERQRLARDIHDGVAQDLAACGYRVDEVLDAATAIDSELVAQLRLVREELSAVLRHLRDSIGVLRSGVLPGSTLADALAEVAHRHAEAQDWELHLAGTSSGPPLPAPVEEELFRIGSEALLNVAKHAAARHVWLDWTVTATSAVIRVADDGVGFRATSARSGSYGLLTMQERAQSVGASLSVQERRPTGTQVEVRLEGSSGR